MRRFSVRPVCRLTKRATLAYEKRHSTFRLYNTMANRTYNDAIHLLNTLQTPYAVLKHRQETGVRTDKTANEEMRKCLTQIGYSQSDLSKLNIVHVAGTKGKGSTCAYVDSILSRYRQAHAIPSNIGLFTSPHLIAVRERIRLNSQPISASMFAKYFFEVWDMLGDVAKPVYFRYLTLMSYHVFLREGVACAIFEVGVGGEYDSTNIAESPAVTGISSLGIDHTYSLGNTIEEIAWHKAGIQKAGCPAFTVTQPPTALRVIEKRAAERYVSSLKVVGVDERLSGVKILPNASFQRLNASLAVALAETAILKLDPQFQRDSGFLSKEFKEGLEDMVWRGRCEKISHGDITWYLDGAHTDDSIIVASKWFGEESYKKTGPKVLIFNQQGHREAIDLLEGLHAAITSQGLVQFDHVIFCPVAAQTDTSSKRDFVNRAYDSQTIVALTMQKSFAAKWTKLDPTETTTITVLASVDEALEHVKKMGSDKEVDVLITGSVHLVGRALGVLEGVDAV